jgi:hypothetical protein
MALTGWPAVSGRDILGFTVVSPSSRMSAMSLVAWPCSGILIPRAQPAAGASSPHQALIGAASRPGAPQPHGLRCRCSCALRHRHRPS